MIDRARFENCWSFAQILFELKVIEVYEHCNIANFTYLGDGW